MFLLFCTANHLMEIFITYMALSEDDPPQTLPLGQYMTYGVTKLGHFQDCFLKQPLHLSSCYGVANRRTP